MNLSNAVRTAKSVITANSPVLLVGTAVAGVVATGVLAAKGGYKARGIIEEAQELKGEDLTTNEKVQLTWLCFATPALTGASTIAATVGVHVIHNKRNAALAGLYAVASTKLDDYKEQAEELLGPKKTQALNDAVAQKTVDREGPFENNEVRMLTDGTELCHDATTGRWFMSSVNKIESAINDMNRRVLSSGEISLNEFYDQVGLEPIPWGETFGWNVQIEPRFGNVTSSDGRPAISVWFHPEPRKDLGTS